MKQITLNEYKFYLVSKYKYNCDNTEEKIIQRKNLLNYKYKNEFLESVIIGTYNFVNKILEISTNNYPGYIRIPLETEPDITYINLDLSGGWKSDTIVKDNNNFYSIGLLEKIFGQYFSIEPCEVELTEDIDENDDFTIVSEIPSYYLYIQCKKEIIDNVRNQFSEDETKQKIITKINI